MTTQTTAPRPSSGTAPLVRRAPQAAMAAGALFVVGGVIQAIDPGDLDPMVRPVEHVMLGVYAVSLLALAPALVALGRRAGAVRSATVAAVGALVLAVGMTTTNLNDQDFSWFPAVAAPANLAWLAGSVVLSVALWRRGGVPRWATVTPAVTWVFCIPLSQLGGPVVPGALWLALGALLASGSLERRAVSVAG